MSSTRLSIFIGFIVTVLLKSIYDVTEQQKNDRTAESYINHEVVTEDGTHNESMSIKLTQHTSRNKESFQLSSNKIVTVQKNCEQITFPSQVNHIPLPIYQFTSKDISPIKHEEIKLSPDQESTLKSWRKSEKTKIFTKTRSEINRMFELEHGGHWKPENCESKSRLAVIVPFRSESTDYNIGREQELSLFLAKMIPLFQQQLIEFKIFIVNQLWSDNFNRARLLNIGYLEAKKEADKLGENSYDCYLMTDVDKFPVNLNVSYHCQNKNFHGRPVHYTPNFGSYGGVAQFSGDTIEAINGFSNMYFGWGGEDQDIGYRLNNANNYAKEIIEQLIGEEFNCEHGRDYKLCIGNHIKDRSLKNPFMKMTLFGELQSRVSSQGRAPEIVFSVKYRGEPGSRTLSN